VAGSGRFCTRILEHFGSRVLVKSGAEGVICGAVPDAGVGIAIKCDDGAGRAAQVTMAALLARLLALDDADRVILDPLVQPVLRNWNGIEVGVLRPGGSLAQRT
jgi:L-asparaginase II